MDELDIALRVVSEGVLPSPSYKVQSQKKISYSSSIRARWHSTKASIPRINRL
jgi:hypothetical protein